MADALTTQQPSTGFISGLDNLTLFRQTGLMVGLAASVAFGIVIALWAQGGEMRSLGQYDSQSMSDVISYLEQNQVKYELDSRGGILVENEKFQKTQIELAAQGFTEGAEDFLKKDSGFGVSQRLEQARLLRSQESQIAKSIEQFAGIKTVQVHLAIPRQISFVGSKKQASASVVLSLYGRNKLDNGQAKAIVDLVSAAIPDLDASHVSLTDQYGRLYHSASMSDGERESEKELAAELSRQQKLATKVESLLTPILGPENFTVQVNVDMDFTRNEQTRKSFNPQKPALTSEKKIETSNGSFGDGGIAGALSNQPPAASTIPQNIADTTSSSETSNSNRKQHVESERHFDIDTTISHTRQQMGLIKKITVSLGINNMDDPANPGTRIVRPQAMIDRINRLIQGVIGYDAERGDLVMIDSFEFILPPAEVAPAPLEFYEQDLFKALWRPIIALFGVLIILFGILRPIMNKLATQSTAMVSGPSLAGTSSSAATDEQMLLTKEESTDLLMAPAPKELEQVVRAKKLVGDDPKMVAALVQNWIAEDE